MRHWRWAVVTGAVAMLCSIPVIRANQPVDDPGVAVAELRERALASADQPFEGLFASRGGLRLPDLGRLDDEVAPFRTTSRVRVWYAAADRWRADELLVGAERSVRREPDGVWTWDSGTRRVVHVTRTGDEPLRIPRLMDLSPAELGRRLLHDAGDAELTAIDARRIAGHVGAGVRITPDDPAGTIRHADLWIEPDSGLVLGVAIDTGGTAPVLETSFADLSFTTPADGIIEFDAEAAGQPVREADSLDPVEAAGRLAIPLPFPDEIAGLPLRAEPVGTLASYGQGLAVVDVLVVPTGGLGRRINALPRDERPWGGRAAVVETSLVNAMITDVDGFDVVVAGTVTVAELDRIAEAVASTGISLIG
jgi:hypothetical protein